VGHLNNSAPGVIIAGGVGGSKAYSVSFDGTNAPSSMYSITVAKQNAVLASDANPLNAGLITRPSQIRFSLDLKVQGALVPTPLSFFIYQADGQYEQTHGIDANNDGDMADGARNYTTVYKPTLVNGNNFDHVQFTIDQGKLGSSMQRCVGPCTNVFLTPIFDPTVSLNWSITFGSGPTIGDAGFGLDAGNSVTIDNVVIEAIPEPSILALLAIGCAATGCRRRR
jgi:hypothetical protein